MNEALSMMIEINLKTEDDFLKIKETLTRIGVSNSTGVENRLYPSVLILHKRGKYYLTHFKCLFLLDGKTASINQLDLVRFKTIANLIRQWGLCEFVNEADIAACEQSFNPKLVKIVPFHEKAKWKIIHKYTIGK